MVRLIPTARRECPEKEDRPISHEAKERLTPQQLIEYQETHRFRGPCCLCVLLDEDFERTEAVFVEHPEYGYMIRCSQNKCGYRSKEFSAHD